MTLRESQRKLFTLWMAGVAPLFIVVFSRTLGHWRSDASEVWGWFSSTVGPIVSFVVASYITTAKSGNVARRQADPLLFRTAMIASSVYLILVLIVLWVANSQQAALPFMHDTAIGLGLVQGVVNGLLGYFLLSSK